MTLAINTQRRLGGWLETLARALAYGGGALLVGMALVTVLSVLGRRLVGLGLGPIPGDFELVELGCAIAVFAFLPLAQLKRSHVTVDVFLTRLPPRLFVLLGLLGDALMTLASAVILWRFWLGFGEKFPYFSEPLRQSLSMGPKPFFPETTYELEIPIWIPYGLALIGALFFAVISAYTVWRSLNWLLQGQEETP
ncbi:MAG: hypothetical protein CSA68_01360 [Rhodobacterales bacterium]|nr:MAG: hypothetical protein CSA68_01360 [Rhodobacterales bacterium]